MPPSLASAPKRLLFHSLLVSSFILLAAILPSASAQTRPSYHITPETKWMNDPQRAVFLEGEWHFYYLWNADWDSANPGAGGTEWYHVTSTDMVQWNDQGVAIEKYQSTPDGLNLGDIETGSSVVDAANTAGFGENALVAVLTQMADGIQQQSLFYSNDSGYTFTPFEGNPVMPSPDPDSKPAFRDPKLIWDEGAGNWVSAVAEGSYIGFYTSADLKDWKFVSTFSPVDSGVDLGTLECPDLYQLDLDGDSGTRVWILAVGANGYVQGKITGTAYWAGTWDGTNFVASDSDPQWMDEGPDFYATVSWENPDDQFGSRYCIGWMNNWGYANELPYYGGFQGQQSLVREIKYQTINESARLVSLPIAGYEALFSSPVSVEGTEITTDAATASLPAELAGGAYVIRATVSKADGDDGDQVYFRVKSDGTSSTTVGYNFANSEVFLLRDSDGSASDNLALEAKEVWDARRSWVNPAGGNTIQLAIYVDWNSVEVFVNDGVAALSALIYPNEDAEGIEVASESGKLTLTSFSYAGIKA